MSEERTRVLELLAAGTITATQAGELLDALQARVASGEVAPQVQAATGATVQIDAAATRRGRPRVRLGDMVGLASCGVTPEYIRALREVGLTDLNAGDLIGMAANDVTPDYIRALRDAGLTDLDADDLIGMAANGVTPAYIAEMAALGIVETSMTNRVARTTDDV